MRTSHFLPFLFTPLWVTACADLPISESLQKSIIGGAKSAFLKHEARIPVETNKKLRDPKLLAYVKAVGERVRQNGLAPDLEFTIIDTNVIQALSGSEVNITSGMLNEIENEAELACLIGHELQHQIQHERDPSHEGRFSNLSEKFFLDAPNAVQGYGIEGDIEHVTDANYSKGNETDADEQGSLMCARAGYDGYALSKLQGRLALRIKTSALVTIKNLTGTHDEMKDRSIHLEKWLNDHLPDQKSGFTGTAEFASAMKKQSKFSAIEISTLTQVANLEKNFVQSVKSEESLLALSHIVHHWHLTPDELAPGVKLPEGDGFMQEKLVNRKSRSILFRGQLIDGVSRALSAFRARFQLGALGALVNFYGLFTGKDFFTEHPLSPLGRKLNALLYGEQMHWNEPLRFKELPEAAKTAWFNAKTVRNEESKPSLGDRYKNNVPELQDASLEPGEIIYSCKSQPLNSNWFSVSKLPKKERESYRDPDCEPLEAFRVKEVLGGHLVSLQGTGPDQFHIPKMVPIEAVLKRIF